MLPLTIPSENKKILQDLGQDKDFNFDPPRFIPPPTPVLSWQAVVGILKDQGNYKVPCKSTFRSDFQFDINTN